MHNPSIYIFNESIPQGTQLYISSSELFSLTHQKPGIALLLQIIYCDVISLMRFIPPSNSKNFSLAQTHVYYIIKSRVLVYKADYEECCECYTLHRLKVHEYEFFVQYHEYTLIENIKKKNIRLHGVLLRTEKQKAVESNTKKKKWKNLA